MKLYKYCKSERAVKILDKLAIKTSAADEFNDPFELSPNIDFNQFSRNGNEKIRAMMRRAHVIDRFYLEEGILPGVSEKDFTRHYLATLDARMERMKPTIRKFVENAKFDFAKLFNDHWRILCLSELNDSILMWSHYGQDHKGVVIEFDSGQPPFEMLEEDSLCRVQYRQEKPDYEHPMKEDDFWEAVRNVAITKAEDWDHEKEVRAFFPYHKSLMEPNGVLPFPSSTVTGLFLGCRISDDDRSGVLKLVEREDLRHVLRFQMRINPSRYALISEAI